MPSENHFDAPGISVKPAAAKPPVQDSANANCHLPFAAAVAKVRLAVCKRESVFVITIGQFYRPPANIHNCKLCKLIAAISARNIQLQQAQTKLTSRRLHITRRWRKIR